MLLWLLLLPWLLLPVLLLFLALLLLLLPLNASSCCLLLCNNMSRKTGTYENKSAQDPPFFHMTKNLLANLSVVDAGAKS